MSAESEGRGDTQQALDRLADLLLFPERFTADPRDGQLDPLVPDGQIVAP